MNYGFEMRVIEIEDMRADAVDERSMHDIEPFAAAEHRSLRGSGKRRERSQRDIDGLVMRPTDCAAKPVQDGAHGLVLHRLCNVAVLRINDKLRERFGDFHMRILSQR